MARVYNRRITFLQPRPTGEKTRGGSAVYGEPIQHEVWAERRDRGGSEGTPAEAVAGGRWEREYFVRADAFPAEVRPDETWKVLDDGSELSVSSVEEEASVSRAVDLRIAAYRSKAKQ